MDRETLVRRQAAEDRARRQGHVLEPWRALYPKQIGGTVAYVAACLYCEAEAFAHRRILDYGDASRVTCDTAAAMIYQFTAMPSTPFPAAGTR
jgi:hypothetical protein